MTRERSTEEFLSAVRRMMRAAARRVAQGDEFELAEFMALKEEYEYCVGQAVAGQRMFGAKSWAQIADGAGNRRSAAQERWGAVEFELWDIEWDESQLEVSHQNTAARGAGGSAIAAAAAPSLPHDSGVHEIASETEVVAYLQAG